MVKGPKPARAPYAEGALNAAATSLQQEGVIKQLLTPNYVCKVVITAAAPFVEGAGAAATLNHVGKGPTPAVAPFVAARVVLRYKMSTQEQQEWCYVTKCQPKSRSQEIDKSYEIYLLINRDKVLEKSILVAELGITISTVV